jgi:hypothetical protein
VLVRSLVLPVRWPDAAAALADVGITDVITASGRRFYSAGSSTDLPSSTVT